MLIYLAARYSRLAEMQEKREELKAFGHFVTSRWVNGGHQIADRDHPAEERARFAYEDYSDVLLADCVISFTEEPRAPSSNRGGRHVEFGIALALHKRVIVVGYRENVFHSMPEVEFYESWAQARAVLGP